MKGYRKIAEAGIVKFDWRTTARWSLRHQWEHEENGRLRDALRHMTERAEDRASEAAACHEIMAECRNIAGDPHNSTTDAVRAAVARAERAEAALRTAAETLRQIIEWTGDSSYGAGMIDIERAARDGLALIAGERQP